MPLFGAPAPVLPRKKKAAPEKTLEEAEEPVSPATRVAPPIPLPGMMRPPVPAEPKQPESEDEEEEESDLRTPHQEAAPPGKFSLEAHLGHNTNRCSTAYGTRSPSSCSRRTTGSASCSCGL
jgi:hypothetical protein